jgi:hypothetical protein
VQAAAGCPCYWRSPLEGIIVDEGGLCLRPGLTRCITLISGDRFLWSVADGRQTGSY